MRLRHIEVIQALLQTGHLGTAAEWLLARGLMTKDTHDSVLRFAPPLIVGEPELEWAAEVIEDALADLAARFPGAQA